MFCFNLADGKETSTWNLACEQVLYALLNSIKNKNNCGKKGQSLQK